MFDQHENHEQSLPPELAALEQQLASLNPTALRVDRDQLMFAAGRASVQTASPAVWSGSKFWPAATAMATAASLLLATMLVWRSNESGRVAAPADGVAAIDVAGRSESGAIESAVVPFQRSNRALAGYLGIRYTALTQEVGRRERNVTSAGGDLEGPLRPATARQILEELLPERDRSST